MLGDPEVICYLNILQEQYVLCPIEKAASNIAFTPKRIRFIKYYIKHLSTSEYTVHIILQQQNNTLYSVFGLKNNGKEFNCFLCIYWLPKIHKLPSGARFIVAGKKYILISN